MKLSKIILENKKYVVREELNLSDEDVIKLAEAITNKLQEYLDVDNRTLLHQSVSCRVGGLGRAERRRDDLEIGDIGGVTPAH